MTKKTRAKARRALLTFSLVLVVAFAAVGSTIAWLSDETETVTNTFAATNIDIWMTETVGGTLKNTDDDQAITNNAFKIIPGGTESKDPNVVIERGSVPCWVFLKVEEVGGKVTVNGTETKFTDFISYTVDPTNWTELTSAAGANYKIYYKQLNTVSTTQDETLNVLAGMEVTYPDTINKAMMDALGTTTPKLVFQSWAIQQAGLKDAAGNLVENSAADAWEVLDAE